VTASEPTPTLSLANIQLAHVGCSDLHAEQITGGVVSGVNLNSEAKYGFEKEHLNFRVTTTLELMSPEGVVARLSAAAVAIFKAGRELTPEDQDLANEVGAAALMITQPFIRESLSDLARRVGLPPVSLGLLRIGMDRPETVTVGDRIYQFGNPTEIEPSTN
jgi:hypothetical protein